MNENEYTNLSTTEWCVMECLWQKSPRTLMQLVKEMSDELGWTKSTTNTMIRRMEKKGFIRYVEGEKARQYYPNIEREDVAMQQTETFLSRVFSGRIGLMVNSLAMRNNLSREDIEELRAILHRATGGEKDA